MKELKLNPNNPRTIGKKEFEKLKNSIQGFTKFLEARPILYDEDKIIWGGNQRYQALTKLIAEGLVENKEEYYKELIDYTLEEKKKAAILDNSPEGLSGEFDYDMLANDYDDLNLDELGIDTGLFEQEEVVEDEAPEVEEGEPDSKLGEVYQLGRHRLMCGDSTKIEDVEKLMDGNKADMVFTDPPYNTQMQQGRHSKEWGIIENDDMTDDKFIDFCQAFVSCIYSFTKEDGHKYICMSWSAYNILYEAMPSVKTCIVWVKNNFGLGHGYRPQHEFILYDGGTLESNSESNVWDERKDASTEYSHPTQKPVAIPSRGIKNSSKSGDIVLDLFGGSGSTLIACEQLDRTCMMSELDPKYIDVIIKRWMKFTGKRAKKIIDADGNHVEEDVKFADESFMQ